MLCPKCSALIGDDSVFCSKCGAAVKETQVTAIEPAGQQSPEVVPEPQEGAADPVVQYVQAQGQNTNPQQIPNAPDVPNMSTYLTQNILLTVFSVVCCLFYALPTAVTGLVFSAIAQGALKQNDLEKARQYIKLARIFMWISFGIEIAVVVITIIVLVLNVSLWTNLFHNGLRDFDFDQFENFKDQIWR